MVLKIQTERGENKSTKVNFWPCVHPTPHSLQAQLIWYLSPSALLQASPYTLSFWCCLESKDDLFLRNCREINRIFVFFYINPDIQVSLCPRDNVNWLEGHCNSLCRKITGHSSLIHNGKKQNMVVSAARILWQQRTCWQMKHNCCLLSSIVE